MNARDELAKLLFTADNSNAKDPEAEWADVTHESQGPHHTQYVYDMADALIAAGYVKHRTITTIEELDALPAGTIIRDPLPCIKWGSGMWGTFSGDSVGSNRIDFPATVLYEPEES